MDFITGGKTVVGSTAKMLNNLKKFGKGCSKELQLFNILIDLKHDCQVQSNIETERCLDAQIRKMVNKYPSICHYREPNLTDVINVKGAPDERFNIISTTNIDPVINIVAGCMGTYAFSDYTFTVAEFENMFVDADDLGYIKIVTLPATGTFQLSGVDIVVNQIIASSSIPNIVYNYGSLTSVGETITFGFQLADNTINPVFSASVSYQICVPEQINQPPTIGNLSINVEENGEHVFTYADLTTGISYSDPEGDDPLNLKVLSLPANGVLYYNGVPVSVNQVITYVDIQAGLFKFTPDDLDVSYTISFNIQVSDQGSGEYSS